MAVQYILAIDQGTTSSRALLFDQEGKIAFASQKELENIYPKPGWCDHDPNVIWDTVHGCMKDVVAKMGNGAKIVGIGLANQRETTVAWSKTTGEPLCNALVWLDTRTQEIVANLERDGGKDRFRAQTGLPVATYFSAVKMKWMLENVDAVRTAAESKDLCFGTVDSWLMYKLTGGKVHVTDVSNAARYMLMNIQTLQWEKDVCAAMGIPMDALPCIKSNCEIYGTCQLDFIGEVPICGSLGDQHAALLGQGCLKAGEVKNTYGTGCFMVMNTQKMVPSTHGLLTTMGFQLGPGTDPCYALEGAVAVAGRSIQWLRDNLEIIESAADVEKLASSVEDSGGVTLVPAFSGLFAPHWRDDARAVITGLSLYSTKAHVARAALEAVAFQVYEVMKAMEADSSVIITALKVDGGMTVNKLLMQFQADICGIDVNSSKMAEATALGAAFAAGLAVKFWSSSEDIHKIIAANGGHDVCPAKMDKASVEKLLARWKDAVPRSFNLSTC